MIQNLAFKIIVGVLVLFVCSLLGYLKYENGQLRADLAHSEKMQKELLWLCGANADTQKRVSEALILSKEPASIESFKGVVDILFDSKIIKK